MSCLAKSGSKLTRSQKDLQQWRLCEKCFRMGVVQPAHQSRCRYMKEIFQSAEQYDIKWNNPLIFTAALSEASSEKEFIKLIRTVPYQFTCDQLCELGAFISCPFAEEHAKLLRKREFQIYPLKVGRTLLVDDYFSVNGFEWEVHEDNSQKLPASNLINFWLRLDDFSHSAAAS